MKRWLFACIISLGLFLRIYQLGHVPISLHGDEVGVGYNAFTLLEFGKDEYNIKFPISFRADVTPLIFYATVPSIAIFGLTDFAIRFPSVVISMLTLIVFFWTSYELGQYLQKTFFSKYFSSLQVAFISLFFLTISPWHIQISRIAHDGSYALLLQILGIGLFIKSVKKTSGLFFLLSGIAFAVSFYSYHSPRLTSPLMFITLIWIFRNKLRLIKKLIFPSLLVMIIIVFPVVIDYFNKPFSQTRLGGINIFIGEVKEPKLLIRMPLKLLLQYKEQLNLQALFIDSSLIRYFHVKNSGLLYIIEIPFFVLGLWFLRNTWFTKLLLISIVIALLPGALTLGPMNAGRIILFLPLWIWICSFGIAISINKYKLSKFFVIYLAMLVVGVTQLFFLKHYFIDSPKLFFNEWQFGIKEAALQVIRQENFYKEITFSSSIKQAYVYVLFYGKKPLSWLMNDNLHRHPFIGYDVFQNYTFQKINWREDLNTTSKLLIAPINEIPATATKVDMILSSTNEPIIGIIKTSQN